MEPKMNEIMAKNIRRTRELRSWTQQHLAEAAGITDRTVQRAEAGQPISAEALQAIAGAFNVAVDDLRRDVDAEQFAAEAKKVTDPYVVVHLQKADSSADLARYLGSGAHMIRCTVNDDAAQDAATEFEQELKELVDIWGDLEPVQRREAAKTAFAHVERLRSLGLVVTVGSHECRLWIDRKQYLPAQCMVVLVAPTAEPKLFATIKKEALGLS
jgi:transcriptional regulator with XRE-family HTH domain